MAVTQPMCAEDDLVAYLASSHQGDREVQEALGIYREWQNFMSTRLLDVERCQRHISEQIPDGPDEEEHCAFIAAMQKSGGNKNTKAPARNKYQKKVNLEKAGRLINYSKQEQSIQQEIDKARVSEWENYMRFNAVKQVSDSEAQKMINAGVEVLPTSWVDVDKHSGLTETVTDPQTGKTRTQKLKPKYKSRLVARGDLQRTYGRTDSPTADPEAVALVCTFAVSEGLTLHVGDLVHGYFQGEKLERKLLLKAPKGGIPGLVAEGSFLLALVPIYGTKDAGRGLWRRVFRVCTGDAGLTENFVFSALYHYAEAGDTKIMLATHVDDLIWACKTGYEDKVQTIINTLLLGKHERGSFRFCGLEYVQHENYEVTKTCQATTEKMNGVKVVTPKPAGEDPEDILTTQDEQQDLQSCVGSLAWVCRMCRPGHCCPTSKLQSVVQKPTLQDLILANETVAKLQKTSKRGISYRKGVKWTSCVVAAAADAGHGGTTIVLDEWMEREAFRSQGGKLIFLASPDAIAGDVFHVSLIAFGSSVLKRVVRSTIQAEAYNLQQVVEEADLIRAAVVDSWGLLDRRNWEESAASHMKSVWFTDCNSVKTALSKPIVKTIDKRLGIELASLRQQLWRYPGRDSVSARVQEGPPDQDDCTDVLRWIDTRVMPTDPLTKIMKDTYLQEILGTGEWDITQPQESKDEKAKKSQWRSEHR